MGSADLFGEEGPPEDFLWSRLGVAEGKAAMWEMRPLPRNDSLKTLFLVPSSRGKFPKLDKQTDWKKLVRWAQEQRLTNQ